MNSLVCFAIDKTSGRRVHISCSREQRTYICEKCLGEMVRVIGSKRTPHFRHKNANKSSASSQETKVHEIAKKLIQEERFLDMGPDGCIYFERVELEQVINNYRIDVVGYSKGLAYLIEIQASHNVDDDKKRALQRLNYHCIEIDLSAWLNKACQKLHEEPFKNAVLKPQQYRWISRKRWFNSFHIIWEQWFSNGATKNESHPNDRQDNSQIRMF